MYLYNIILSHFTIKIEYIQTEINFINYLNNLILIIFIKYFKIIKEKLIIIEITEIIFCIIKPFIFLFLVILIIISVLSTFIINNINNSIIITIIKNITIFTKKPKQKLLKFVIGQKILNKQN